ncbi:hypothetical protein, partial [Chryseobacterium gambrini]|uniref:hypothetical protein n=1 Tax=Chryseobacterium gambrini TaxID=373672 RepID=UPI0025B367F7
VAELEEMIHMKGDPTAMLDTGHHGPVDDAAHGHGQEQGDDTNGEQVEAWTPEVVETVATSGEGIAELIETLDAHRASLEATG